MTTPASDFDWAYTGLRLTDGPWIEFGPVWDRLPESEKIQLRIAAEQEGMVILNDMNPEAKAAYLATNPEEEWLRQQGGA